MYRSNNYETQEEIITGIVDSSYFEIKEVRKNTFKDCTVKAFFGKCRIDIIENCIDSYKLIFLGDDWCPDLNKVTENHTLESLGKRLEELAQLTDARLIEDKKIKLFLQELTGYSTETIVIWNPLTGVYSTNDRLVKMHCGSVEAAQTVKQQLESVGITLPVNDAESGTAYGFLYVTAKQINDIINIDSPDFYVKQPYEKLLTSESEYNLYLAEYTKARVKYCVKDNNFGGVVTLAKDIFKLTKKAAIWSG